MGCKNFEQFSAVLGTETAALVDIFPFLRYLPDWLMPMVRHGKELHQKEFDLFVEHYRDTKRRLREGKAKVSHSSYTLHCIYTLYQNHLTHAHQPCFCADLVRAQEQEGFSDGLAGYTSGSLLEAGSDTTAATLIGFIQGLLCAPEAAAVAQAQLDAVCGDRLPELNDIADLPYLRGCIKESMRWMPTAILGVPHSNIRDDEYLGYRIPRGSEIMCNVW